MQKPPLVLFQYPHRHGAAESRDADSEHGPVQAGLTYSCSWVSVWTALPLSDTEENVHTHVSVLQREGPGSIVFNRWESRGVRARLCVQGLLACVLPLSVNK